MWVVCVCVCSLDPTDSVTVGRLIIRAMGSIDRSKLFLFRLGTDSIGMRGVNLVQAVHRHCGKRAFTGCSDNS